MLMAAVILIAIGSIGVVVSTILEWRLREPIYKLFMKIFPWFIGVGGVLMGIYLSSL